MALVLAVGYQGSDRVSVQKGFDHQTTNRIPTLVSKRSDVERRRRHFYFISHLFYQGGPIEIQYISSSSRESCFDVVLGVKPVCRRSRLFEVELYRYGAFLPAHGWLCRTKKKRNGFSTLGDRMGECRRLWKTMPGNIRRVEEIMSIWSVWKSTTVTTHFH